MNHAPASPTLDAQRQACQLDLLSSGAELLFGALDGLPWHAAELATMTARSPAVAQTFDGGLTATVHRLEAQGRHWTLKIARSVARVHNIDGRTSFLNEVQRRIDIEALKRAPGGEARWTALVDTQWASLRHGVILSPWIEGKSITRADWDERRLSQVLEALCALWLEGLFDWDLAPGNLLDDGRQLRLFDFGYCYRFDPLRQFSSAGGGDLPMFHPAERFETRSFCAALLETEQAEGEAAALAAFRLEKLLALQAYRQLRSDLRERGAAAHMTAWLDGITARWAAALAPGGDLDTLYLSENWRSHLLDLDDDLRGRSCTPMTLRRADWLLAALQHHEPMLRAAGALFHGDEALSCAALIERYTAQRQQALAFLTSATPPASP
ncbi:hypothetical protein ACFJGW_12730 [Burkholderiaceae bacterium UC74_6]